MHAEDAPVGPSGSLVQTMPANRYSTTKIVRGIPCDGDRIRAPYSRGRRNSIGNIVSLVGDNLHYGVPEIRNPPRVFNPCALAVSFCFRIFHIVVANY